MESEDAWHLTSGVPQEQGKADPFAAAVRATRMPMIITDPRVPDNPIVFANDAFLALTGYDRNEIVGRNCRFLQGEGTDREAVRRVREAVAAGRDIRVDLLNYRKDGTPFHNALYISPVFSEAGEAEFFFASQFDVTEQMAAQAALAQREAELRLIVEGASDYAIVTIDPERRVTSWSKGAESAFGWTADEMIGRPADVLFTPEDRAIDRPGHEVATAAAEGCADDARWHQRKDGTRVFMNGSVHPLPKDEHGREQGFIKIARDETARRRAEDRLRETEERYRLAARATNDAVWDWRIADGHVIWNEALAELFGHGQTETDARWRIEHIHPDDRARVDHHMHEVIAGTGTAWSSEYRFLRADGSYAHVFDRGHVLRDKDGAAVRMIGAMLDLSARKRTEADLVQANALLSAVMEAVPGVVYAKDRDGRMLAANRGTAELVGKPAAEFLGRTDREFLADEDEAETVMANDRRVMDRGRIEVLEERVSMPDGKPAVWLSTRRRSATRAAP